MAEVERVVLSRDHKGEWRYREYAGNNEDIGGTEEGLTQRHYAIERAVEANPDAEFFEDIDGEIVPLDVSSFK